MDAYIEEIERTTSRNETQSSFYGTKGKFTTEPLFYYFGNVTSTQIKYRGTGARKIRQYGLSLITSVLFLF